MSYTRHFKKAIDIPLSISVSDPSVHGNSDGSVSRSSGSVNINFNGDHYSIPIGSTGGGSHRDCGHKESVEVVIEVDTEPFDDSIGSCKTHVDALTGSVVATEAAQVASVAENSKKVATTIITGFFKNVQAEIGSRILELSQRVDSRLMHLREQAKMLQSKKEQMQTDYQRTKSRYIKLFDDLNKELENRVKALDEPIFKMVANVEGESGRMMNADFAEVVSVVAKENAALSAQIGATLAKKRAQQAISGATDFLRIQRRTDMAINRSTISGLKAEDGVFYLPVCYFEMNEVGGVVKHDCVYDRDHLPTAVRERVDDVIFSNPEKEASINPVERENVEKYFNTHVQEAMKASSSPHDIRVVNTISKLFLG